MEGRNFHKLILLVVVLFSADPGCSTRSSGSGDAGGDGDGSSDADIDSDTDSEAALCGDEVLDGDVLVKTQDDVQALASYTWVTGNVEFEGPELTDVSALDELRCVAGQLSFSWCSSLTDIGLNGLRKIGEGLWFSSFEALESLNGLDNLTWIGDSISITHNDALTSLGGFGQLELIPGSLRIEQNENLASVTAFAQLQEVGGALMVQLPWTEDLAALSSVRRVGGPGPRW